MKFKIKANTFATQRYLQIDEGGVSFTETALMGGKKRFRFDEIDLVLMSEKNELSFQVGQQVFQLPIKPNNRKHQQAIQALILALNQSQGAA